MRCLRPGCTGQIDDGYCDRCGFVPVHRPGRPAPLEPLTQRGAGPAPRTRSIARPQLGAGLVEVPAIARRDPMQAVMATAEVAEPRRFCRRCGSPVGRSRDGSAGRTVGYCPRCGAPFSFVPKLRAGDVVGDQYEVAGCLAHGGLGWIYLARDRNVADRWVVLKGLLASDDDEAIAAALAERLFLAEVEHPNIVKIINFVEREGAGYIVMEFVDGVSLKALLVTRRAAAGGLADPIPAAQAIAYVLEILPALSYLHHMGLLYCDMKPDNVIQTRDTLKLIDLGAVYRIGDTQSPVYGTLGYQAPEIEQAGPSVASDLFTVARTLAVLCIDLEGVQSTMRFALPEPHECALFRRYDSLYRLLCRGTAPDPADRFGSAEEMAEQLLGVLREVVADETGTPAPARSTLFTADLRARSDGADGRLLPALRVATDDPAAGYLATLAAVDPDELVGALRRAPERTVEVDLRLAQALVTGGEFAAAGALLDEIEQRDRWEWRAHWYRGVAALARKLPNAAITSFELVHHVLPGELAPKLALGVCEELANRPAEAAKWYEIVSRTDPSYSTAAFGLARCRLACGEREAALAAYARVPESSIAYDAAQSAWIAGLLSGKPKIAELRAAAASLDALALDGQQRGRLTADLLRAALDLLQADRAAEDPAVTLGGRPLLEFELRLGLERTYRSLAAVAASTDERIRLVDAANRVRPRSWI